MISIFNDDIYNDLQYILIYIFNILFTAARRAYV